MEKECNNKETKTDQIEAIEVAKILGDTIIQQDAPLTVGIYGKWNSGKSEVLLLTEEHMKQKLNSTDPKEFSITILTLLYRLIFFYPILNSKRTRKTKYIFVTFSILDYAGSDRMWAGVITKISNQIEKKFGSWSVKIFRAWFYSPRRDLEPFLTESTKKVESKSSWKPVIKFALCKFLLIVILIVVALFLWIKYGVPELSSETDNTMDAIIIFVTASAGILGATQITTCIHSVSNLIFNQKEKIERMAAKPDFSESLGFMDKVKNEVYYITATVKYMSILLDCDIRLCLMIDDVDLLRKQGIMNLFQIISILHHSRNSLYVQVLCMDPMLAANTIQKSLLKQLSSNVNGHAFLKKHIQLPFHIPTLGYRQKPFTRSPQVKFPVTDKKSQQVLVDSQQDCSDTCAIEMKRMISNHDDSFEKSEKKVQPTIVIELKGNIIFDSFLDSFIEGNQRALQRVLLSSQLAVNIMATSQNKYPSEDNIRKMVAWTTFVDQWPYRISWIYQLIEDNLQMNWVDFHMKLISDKALLEEVFYFVEPKLNKPEDWQNLLDLDSDPEIFIKFLQAFPFTVADLKSLMPFTTNLNNSLRRIIAFNSAKTLVKKKAQMITEELEVKWTTTSLENWTVDDVSSEIENMKIIKKNVAKYQQTIRDKKINGKILNSASKSEMQMKLNMVPRDWNVFWRIITAHRIFKSALNDRSSVEEESNI